MPFLGILTFNPTKPRVSLLDVISFTALVEVHY